MKTNFFILLFFIFISGCALNSSYGQKGFSFNQKKLAKKQQGKLLLSTLNYRYFLNKRPLSDKIYKKISNNDTSFLDYVRIKDVKKIIKNPDYVIIEKPYEIYRYDARYCRLFLFSLVKSYSFEVLYAHSQSKGVRKVSIEDCFLDVFTYKKALPYKRD